MKYLIIKCEELGDQWECDANRTPITMTNDWQAWYKKAKPDYYFEVYEYKNNQFVCVKNYEASMEQGMAFVWYDDSMPECTFNVIERFPNFDRYTSMPVDLYERALEGEDFDDSLKNCGYVSWAEGDRYYAYTEYYDNRICSPY